MEGNSVGRIDDYVVPSVPPPSPREPEEETEAVSPAQEPREETGKTLDLFA